MKNEVQMKDKYSKCPYVLYMYHICERNRDKREKNFKK